MRIFGVYVGAVWELSLVVSVVWTCTTILELILSSKFVVETFLKDETCKNVFCNVGAINLLLEPIVLMTEPR